MTEKLHGLCMKSLASCQHHQHPTFNTLVASLLSYSCGALNLDPTRDVSHCSEAVLAAQRMGIHHGRPPLIGTDTMELRTQVWCHILWLDVQVAVLSGLGTITNRSSIKRKHESNFVLREKDSPVSVVGSRPSEIFAIGRFEVTRFLHSFLDQSQESNSMDGTTISHHLSAIKKLHDRIRGLVTAIPAEGEPEKGVLAFGILQDALANATLFQDLSQVPTVLGSCIRIMLTTMKLESAFIFLKPFLTDAATTNKVEEKRWKKYVKPSSSRISQSEPPPIVPI